jgi:hypothetical protein
VTAAAALLTKAQPAIAAFGRFPKLRAFARKAGRALVALAAAVVAPIALLTLYIWMVQQGAGNSPTSLDAWPEVALVCGGIALFGLIAFLAEPTAWSLHQFYKRALMSCFCIGWQPKDGLAVSDRDYAPAYVWSGWKLPERPELIIAAAATISTYGAAPAGENVLPFVLSKREMGFSNGWRPGENVTAVERKPGVGARFDTGALIDACRNGKRGWRPWRNGARNLPNLTLPASVAITGAAVSPSMGKRTIPPIRMLLALFNLRLGVWLPNPENDTIREAVIDKKEFRCAPAALHTLREYVGRNKRDGKFVYVSDGGHYENLGLVETLRRGCTTVYCIDASGDPPGDPRTLTEAMRLAEAELDISWDRNSSKALAQLGLRSDQSKSTTKAEGDKADSRGQSPPRVTQTWTTLEFHNKAKRPGRVHVIKTGISETTPEHLRAYQNWRPTFPYDGTGNQLFRADRFDAYRELGYHSATTALKAIKARSTQRASAAKKPVSRTRSVVQGRHTAAPPRSKSPGH